MLRTPVLALALVLTMAGCADTEAAPAAASSTAPAAEPSAAADVGSITGRVVDDELVPIKGAELALTPSGAKTTSDEAGAFTFNDLTPGTHVLYAVALGYVANQFKVEVAAGEVTTKDIQLKPVPLVGDPYLLTRHGVAFLNLAVVDASYLSALKPIICAPCDVYFIVDAGPQEVR
ncbi:MAG TPA: carboxypeptidase-like regulatory domain-containing protein, partial [Candidatus Thermoplasmatota archaeon]|nr:carboxypeptidase-like regulatory domain-containing protein [Candidatus Thermoplasmatota archaeon]